MKKSSNISTFSRHEKKFKIAQEKKRLRSENLAEKVRCRLKVQQAAANRQISKLLAEANRNMRDILTGKNADLDFKLFVTKLFKLRGNTFSDSVGFCGFPPPPMNWTMDPETEKVLGIPATNSDVEFSGKRLVGTLKDYEVSVSVLVIYDEHDGRGRNDDLFRELADGEQHPLTSRVIALTARREHLFSSLTAENIQGCRVVLLRETYVQSLNEHTYDPIDRVPTDRRFADVLRHLSNREKTFQFFLNKFNYSFALD